MWLGYPRSEDQVKLIRQKIRYSIKREINNMAEDKARYMQYQLKGFA